MKRSLILISAMLVLVPVASALADPATVKVAYLGKGIFQYKKKSYKYDALVAKVQADYSGDTLGLISVNMGSTASQLDKATVCQLRQSFLTQVKMYITVDGEKREMFCT